MKTKKELDAARKTEGELQVAMASLTAQLETGKQDAEQSKVGPSTHRSPSSSSPSLPLSQVEMASLTAKLQSMQQQVTKLTYNRNYRSFTRGYS